MLIVGFHRGCVREVALWIQCPGVDVDCGIGSKLTQQGFRRKSATSSSCVDAVGDWDEEWVKGAEGQGKG